MYVGIAQSIQLPEEWCKNNVQNGLLFHSSVNYHTIKF